MNKTKVIATVSTTNNSTEMLKEYMLNGIDVFRINLSYANHDFCTDVLSKINKLNNDLGLNIATLLDTRGSVVKTGRFQGGKATFKINDKIRVYMSDILGDETKLSVDYDNLMEDVKYNTVLKITPGNVELKVLDKDEDSIICEVIEEGTVEDYSDVSAIGCKLKLPFLSIKDMEDIKYACEHKVDYLALSRVYGSEDILEVNDMLIELGNDHMGIIAKIETPSAVEEIDDIIKASEGVLIARDDLGIQIPFERIPGIQKSIINKCHRAGNITIVATELFHDEDGEPSRAEVSDIANAILDGTDAIMLSGQIRNQINPAEDLQTLSKIIDSAEKEIDYIKFLDSATRTESSDVTGSIACSVATMAYSLKCKAIVAPTISGYTAKKMSRFKPSCPIIAVSPDENTVRSLQLYFGVYPVLIADLKSLDTIMERSKEIAKSELMLERDDKIIITGGYPFKKVKHTNFMKIEEL